MILNADTIISIADAFSVVISFLGVLVIVGGIFIVFLKCFKNFLYSVPFDQNYKFMRKNVGRSILLGLELLLAGDIISSVTGTPSFDSVVILGIIVFIRAFLGITFEMELDGHWPWQKHKFKG